MPVLLDPDDVCDMEFDWSSRLTGGETISSAVVLAPGLTVAPGARATVTATTKVTVWLTGGTNGARYEVKCTIVTSAGRQYDHTERVRMLHR